MARSASDCEYQSTVTLMLLGDNLVPGEITRLLSLRPTQAWRRGEPSHRASDPVHGYGGWKKALPESQVSRPLPSQLRYWVRTLAGRSQAIATLAHQGHLCSLSCYIASSGTASIIVPPELQRAVAALGLELRLSFFAQES
ncbi:DUF4279 domain-containing protein [Piscinibacter aquaticus]|uniref:DUF4279 domain-containing protein n=1 Tax=Piscinibacter aquaticus TaxID=392597 RepID=A0A5C6U0J2_9BURK|nr:DUF4279 domain-containing protein [Piscinibacter aquaticus]